MTKHLSAILATAALTISLANAVPTLAASVRSTDDRLAALEQQSFDMCAHLNMLWALNGRIAEPQLTCRSVFDS